MTFTNPTETEFYLFTSQTTDFSGSPTNLQATAVGNSVTFTGVNLADGDFFTIGAAILDTDGDLVADVVDIDDDNDGILDTAEGAGDADTDLVVNRLDRDSDNDGIYDSIEAGYAANDTNADGIIDGVPADFGANGFANALEAGNDSGVPLVDPANTDMDPILDAYQTDSDGDTCNDVREAGFTDTDGDGQADNTGVDAFGVLEGSDGYTAPTDANTNMVFDFQEAEVAPAFVTQPTDEASVPGGSVTYSVTISGNGLQFQWQVSIDNGATFADVANNANTTGAQTAFLTLQNLTASANGNQYRMVANSNVFACALLTSDVANLEIATDTDGDLVGDTEDLDDDNDGIMDTAEIGDTDGDGIADALDLDSDNDGIFDIVESGNPALDTDNSGRINGVPATFGANGHFNALENNDTQTAVSNLVLTDTDEDTMLDAYDLDSDGDGCNDVREAGFADPDGDGKIGLAVNQNGLVNGANYASPADMDGNMISDFQERNNYITSQPTLRNVAVNAQTTFAVFTAIVPISYQWEVSTDLGATWAAIADGADYAGTATSSMTINSAAQSFDTYQYRVGMVYSNYVCGNIYSNPASLFIDRDSDGDGILDLADLDDDNDGIKDLDECEGAGNFSVLLYNQFNFREGTNVFTLPAGQNTIDNFQNFTDGAGISSQISTTYYTGTTANNNGANPTFATISGLDSSTLQEAQANNDYIELTLDALEFCSINNVGFNIYNVTENTIGDINLPINDLLGMQVAWFLAPDGVNFEQTPFFEQTTTNSGDDDITGTGTPDPDSTNDANNSVQNAFVQPGTFKVRIYFFDAPFENGHIDDIQMTVLGLSTCTNDFDGDGIVNSLDLDSDNDGIWDAVEAGHGATLGAEGRIDTTVAEGNGPGVGANGLADSVEESNDNAVYTYAILNSDGSDQEDFRDLDSDDDGCNDVNEAGLSDDDGDGTLGVIPFGVDANGVINSIPGYPTNLPDGNMSGTPDFREAGAAPTFNVQPSNSFTTTGSTVVLGSEITPNNLPVQWQISTDNGNSWTNIADGGQYTGATSAMLTIANVQVANNGELYRLEVETPGYVCGNLSSLSVILNVEIDTDGDGISDLQDMDDDNDGVPDYLDAYGIDKNAPCLPPAVNFENPALESGVAGEVGAAYRFSNILPGLDGIAEIKDKTANAALVSIDQSANGQPEYWQPSIVNNLPIAGTTEYVEIEVRVVFAGSNTPFTIPQWGGVLFDADGSMEDEIVSIQGMNSYATDVNSPITSQSVEGGFMEFFGDGTNFDIATENTEANVFLGFVQDDKFVARFGTQTANNKDFYLAVGECLLNKIDTPVPVFFSGYDADGDGIMNHLDLDSDGDGILDIVEVGQGASDANGDGIVDGAPADFGANGMLDALESAVDNGQITYSPINSDGDAAVRFDFLDIDADNDGIVDNLEAQTTGNYFAPLGADDDGDGVDNQYDVDFAGNNAFDPTNTDGEDQPDFRDLDSDNDMYLDVLEGWDTNASGVANTQPTGADNDRDGLDDAFDFDQNGFLNNGGATNNGSLPTSFPDMANMGGDLDWREAKDSDGDGANDTVDPDDDNDGILDTDECTEAGIQSFGISPTAMGIDFNTHVQGTDVGPTDLSAQMGLPTGSVIVTIVDANVIDNGGRQDNWSVQSQNSSNWSITGTKPTLLKLLHGPSIPFNTSEPDLGENQDGFVVQDGTVLNFTGTLEQGYQSFAAAPFSDVLRNDRISGGQAYYVAAVDATADGANNPFGATAWESDGLRGGYIFDAYTTLTNGNVNFYSVALEYNVPCEDTDGDGFANSLDLDSDGDGISDIREANGGSDAADTDLDGKIGTGAFVDTDGDGLGDLVDTDDGGTAFALANSDTDALPDFLDIDSDGDGIVDLIEAQSTAGFTAPTNTDTDNDGIDNAYDGNDGGTTVSLNDEDGDGTPDYLDLDSDEDGVADDNEGWDTDGDGTAETVAANSDADGDGLDDAYDSDGNGTENAGGADNNGSTPNSFPNVQQPDGDLDWREGPDFDQDGIQDAQDPDDNNDGILDVTVGAADTDGDGIPDRLDMDIDGDGILNIVELNNGDGSVDPDGDGVPGTGPQADTDGDGILDQFDPDNDGTPTAVVDADLDMLDDWADIDSDGDGIVDIIEAQTSASYQAPSSVDSDGDGIDDIFDPSVGGTKLNPVNSDGTDEVDYLDLDTDNDGESDGIEGHDTDGDGTPETVAAGADSDNDGLDDAFDSDMASAVNVGGPDNNGQSPVNLPDVDEVGGNPDWRFSPDFDGDGILDAQDPDDNNDGLLDATVGTGDTDGDGIPDNKDYDIDGDGITNIVEANGGDATIDPDGDGIVGTGPITDTDGDGIPDQFDVDDGGTPLVAVNSDTDLLEDWQDIDSDGDGIVDNIEAQGTADFLQPSGQDGDFDGIDDSYDPDGAGTPLVPVNFDGDLEPDYLDLDTDGDAETDAVEGWDTDGDGTAETIAVNMDSDNDGLDDAFDFDEAGTVNVGTADNGGTTPGSFPDNDEVGDEPDWRFSPDSDGDGILNEDDPDDNNDGLLDVTVGDGDTDGDGIPDRLDYDIDGDGITNIVEANNGDASVDPDGDGIPGTGVPLDTDGDGLIDAVDPDNGGTALDVVNTDMDGLQDWQDIDSDGDGIVDIVEAQTTADFIAPTGLDDDSDGIDNAYDPDGGTPIVLSDVDLDMQPDYLDTDADNDTEDDAVEGWDTDGDGTAETVAVGADADMDGLDDAFDSDGTDTTNNGGADNDGTTPTDLPDNDEVGGEPDWRQSPDADGDGITDALDPDDNNDGLLDATVGDGDTDGDGIPNTLDYDIDGDGILNVVELNGGDASIDPDGDGIPGTGVPMDTDGDGLIDFVDADNGGEPAPTINTDGDGQEDWADIDSDNDGIVDIVEAQTTAGYIAPSGLDTDGNGVDDSYDLPNGGALISPSNTDGLADGPDYLDTDTDNDGILDQVEAYDTDGDNVAEILPTGNDTDGDGLDDAFDSDGTDATNNGEADNDGTVPTDFPDDDQVGNEPDWREGPDSDGDGVEDAFDPDDNNDGLLDTVVGDGDTDGDGIPNRLDMDIDGDGILNIIEVFGGSPTLDPDGDGALGAGIPLDTDGDGLPDMVDPDNGGNAIPTLDLDGDGLDDWTDIDTDGDGIIDFIEAQTTGGFVELSDEDENQNGLDDAFDVAEGGTVLIATNTDGADNPDYMDLDTDNDGLPDLIEGWDTDGDGIADVLPTGNDSDGDGLDDAFDTDGTSTTNAGGPDNTETDPADFPDNHTPGGEPDWRQDDDFVDSDDDGDFDLIDNDDDNDGIADTDEGTGDTDGDGVIDALDLDSDNDGIADTIEGNIDTDGDGVPDFIDLDSDDDGISDINESGQGDEDENNDGIADGVDTDGDGIIDSVDSTDTFGGWTTEIPDTDNDGEDDYQDVDSDGDGLTDLFENGQGNLDADNDGRIDGGDGDGDGIKDAVDSDDGGFGGFNQGETDTDGDGTPNATDEDSDGDGILDRDESTTEDCDSDGTVDYLDPDPCITEFTFNEIVTPNDDNMNDTWAIENITQYPGLSVQIFNRWGNEVFGADNYENNWSGQNKDGEQLVDGTYYYLLDKGDGSDVLTGYIYLRRQ